MGKPEKIERLGLSLAPLLQIIHGEAAELDQAGLLRIHLQPELLHPLFQGML